MGTLALFPLSELAVQIVNALVISLLPPDPLPKMEFKDGIPADHATLVVVPMMLSSTEVVRQEVEKLEVRFLANQEANVFFSLFADFTDSPEATAFGDGEVLAAARQGIEQLNRRYPRRPLSSVSPAAGMVGKRAELDRPGTQARQARRPQRIPMRRRRRHPSRSWASCRCPIRYVITLDADTQLPPGQRRGA